MQLIAYCFLVGATYDMRPAYGVIRYPQQQFEIEFTPERVLWRTCERNRDCRMCIAVITAANDARPVGLDSSTASD